MARPTIAQIRGQVDLQKTYYWEFSVLAASPYFNLNPTRLNMQCTSLEVPRYEGETAEVMFKGYQILDPGIYKAVGKITLTFVEMVDSQVRAGWDAWIAACSLKSGTFNQLYSDFRLVSMDNQENANYEYNMKWCFPDASDPAELESENSNPMEYKVTLRYTDVQIVPLAGGGGTIKFVA